MRNAYLRGAQWCQWIIEQKIISTCRATREEIHCRLRKSEKKDEVFYYISYADSAVCLHFALSHQWSGMVKSQYDTYFSSVHFTSYIYSGRSNSLDRRECAVKSRPSAKLNSDVFSLRWNCVGVASRNDWDSEFQLVGPDTAKLRGPNVDVLVRGTARSLRVEERIRDDHVHHKMANVRLWNRTYCHIVIQGIVVVGYWGRGDRLLAHRKLRPSLVPAISQCHTTVEVYQFIVRWVVLACSYFYFATRTPLPVNNTGHGFSPSHTRYEGSRPVKSRSYRHSSNEQHS